MRLQAVFEKEFAGAGGAYYLSAAEHDGLILRPAESYDGATPSSNSVAAMNLLRLHAFTGEDRYRKRADEVLGAFSALAEKAAPAFPRLLSAADFAAGGAREIVLSGTPGRADFDALRSAVFASPGLNRVLAHASRRCARGARSPARGPRGGRRRSGAGSGACVRLRELRVPGSRRRSGRALGRASGLMAERRGSLKRPGPAVIVVLLYALLFLAALFWMRGR